MNATPEVEAFQHWLITQSAQAGVLILLVLSLQWAFRKKLKPRWRFALWWVVLLRLVLPAVPESSWSVFNWVQQPGSPIVISTPASAPKFNAAAIQPASEPRPDLPGLPAIATQTLPSRPDVLSAEPAPAAQPKSRRGVALSALLVGTWAMVTLALGAGVATRWFRFIHALRRNSAPASTSLSTLFESCCAMFRYSGRVELVETHLVDSPALFGLFHPQLLLPPGMEDQFTHAELRHVFLHEIAHLKRRDLWLNWLITVLQLMHWFNPLVWIGFARLRADRELACDELALLQSGEASGQGYGATVVKLLEQIHSAGAVPGGVGILEERSQMQRRIRMIAAFRRQGGWSAPAILLLALVGAVALTDAQTPKPKPKPAEVRGSAAASSGAVEEPGIVRLNLKGTVEARDGEPLPSPAMVFIRTAAPRTGTSPLCPSCYPDCSKSTKTAAAGSFTLEGLSSQLKFEVLAVAKGFKPKSKSGVDPSSGPLVLSLDPIESTEMRPDRSLRGRVVDPQGAPVRAAVVEMVGVQSRDGGGRYGQIAGFDPLAVTDENGEFVLTGREAFDRMTVQVQARGFAPKRFPSLASGGAQNSLTVTEGVTIRGRILGALSGLQGVAIGACGADRSVEVFLGHYEVGTGKDGVFELTNLPADGDYYVYSLMKSMDGGGGVSLQKTHVGADGTTTDLGDLKVVTGFPVVGRVELSDGSELPSNTRVMIGRDLAWDSIQASADDQGRFEFRGVPGETVSLSIRRRGWKLSESNVSLDLLNPFSLVGRVDSGCTNLVVKLEPGEPKFNRQLPPGHDYQAAKESPLRGAEATRVHPTEWRISGRVLDKETAQPIKQFRITTGAVENWRGYQWEGPQSVRNESGEFAVGIRKVYSQPAIKIEADGYLPEGTAIVPQDATGIEFQLRKGAGPRGRVIHPDGTPASQVSLALVGRGYNWAHLAGSRLGNFSRDELLAETAADGKFTFAPDLEATYLLASSDEGFGAVSLSELQKLPELKLQPYARIRGIAKRDGIVQTNLDLDIGFASSTDFWVDGLGHTITDSKGRFEFDRVPSGSILIQSREYNNSTRMGWASRELKEVQVSGGEVLDVELAVTAPPASPSPVGSPAPSPKRIAGAEITGVVLSPDGNPVTGAQVAIQVPEVYLGIGRGRFLLGPNESGTVVRTTGDGRFSLPFFQNAHSLVAISPDGIAQVRVDSVRAEGRIKLEKWAAIQGALWVGGKPAGARSVFLAAKPEPGALGMLAAAGVLTGIGSRMEPLQLDFNAFYATTAQDGRFLFSMVPPGRVVIQEMALQQLGGRSSRVVDELELQAGETVRKIFGAADRQVTGRCPVWTGPGALTFEKATAILRDPAGERALTRWSATKSPEERKHLASMPGFTDSMALLRNYTTPLGKDGEFLFAGVVPGSYKLYIHYSEVPPGSVPPTTRFLAVQPVEVRGDSISRSVDLGLLELRQLSAAEAEE